MPTIDLRKQLKHLYQPPAKKFSVVDVPPMNFLMIDGAASTTKSTSAISAARRRRS